MPVYVWHVTLAPPSWHRFEIHLFAGPQEEKSFGTFESSATTTFFFSQRYLELGRRRTLSNLGLVMSLLNGLTQKKIAFLPDSYKKILQGLPLAVADLT